MKSEVRIVEAKLGDFIPDSNNANPGTERGNYALEESIQRFGPAPGMLVDKKNRLVGGNKTHAKLGEIGIEDCILVQWDGKKPLVVQRDDLDLDDPKTVEMAIALNRTRDLNSAWDAEQMQHCLDMGANVDAFFRPDELDAILIPPSHDDDDSDTPPEKSPKPAANESDRFPIPIVLDWSNHQRWQDLKQKLGYKRDTEAFLAMMDAMEQQS